MHVGSDHLSRYGGGCVELHLSRSLLQRCACLLKVLHLELLLLLLTQRVDGDGLSRHLSSQRLRSHPRLLLLLGVWRHLPSLSLNLLLLLLLNHLLNGLGLSLSLMLLHHLMLLLLLLLLLLLKQLHPGLMHLVLLLLLLVLGLLLLLL